MAHEDLGRPPVPYTWLATGSFGRFEPFPSSDVDCAIAWEGPDDDIELRRTMITLAEHVLRGLETCGFPPDSNTAVASNPLFARSIDEWERAARTWVEQPDLDRGVLLLSVVVESDPVWGPTDAAAHLATVFAQAPNRELMLRRLGAAARGGAPADGLPARFRAPLERRAQGRARHQARRAASGRVLARWSGLRAGVSAASTRARLKASRGRAP